MFNHASFTALLALLAAACLTQQAGAQDPLAPVVREALRNNLGLARERLAAERGEAAVRQARALYLPSLTLDSRRSEMRGVVDVGDFVNPAYRALNQVLGRDAFPTNVSATLPQAQETRLRLAQPLYNRAIAAGYRASTGLRDAQDAGTRAAARQLAADAQLAWLAAASAERVAGLYRATLALVEENVRVTERLLANGTATPDAVLRARADRGEVAQQLAEAEQRRDGARRALGYALGRPDGDAAEDVRLLADSLLDFPLDRLTLDDALRSARARREELTQADAGERVAAAQQRAASAAFYPTAAVAVDYGVQGSEYRFDRRSDVLVASLVVQWNLFSGGQDAARRDQAALDRRRARLTRADAERAIELQVRQAYDAAAVARGAIATADERLAAARRAYELVSRRCQEGLASQLELLDARAAYTRAGLNLILTRYAYATRWVELERAAALRDLDF